MRVGSTAARISLVTSNEEAAEILAEAHLDSADFWLYLCSLDEQYPLCREDWKAWVLQIRKKFDSLHLPVSQCHARFNIFIPPDFAYVPPLEIILRNMHACRMLGCRKLVFHPVELLSHVTSEETHGRILRYNLRWFRELLPLAEALDLEIHVENMFDFAGLQQEGEIPFAFTTVEDLCWLIDALDHPLVKACFDTGHANISGLDVPDAIRQLGHRLGTLHLQDNFGRVAPIEPDVHLLPGHGLIDWLEVMAALREIGFDGVLNMEPVDSLPRLPRELMVHQLSSAAEFLRKLARHCGLA